MDLSDLIRYHVRQDDGKINIGYELALLSVDRVDYDEWVKDSDPSSVHKSLLKQSIIRYLRALLEEYEELDDKDIEIPMHQPRASSGSGSDRS